MNRFEGDDCNKVGIGFYLIDDVGLDVWTNAPCLDLGNGGN